MAAAAVREADFGPSLPRFQSPREIGGLPEEIAGLIRSYSGESTLAAAPPGHTRGSGAPPPGCSTT